MHAPASLASAPTRLQRVGAALGVALLLLLAVASVSPALHHWLHATADAEHEAGHQCAVVLFASGLTLAAALTLAAPARVWRGARPAAPAELLLVAPRYLRQPERGPPAV